MLSSVIFLTMGGCGGGAGTHALGNAPGNGALGSVQLTLGAPIRNTDGSPVADLAAYKIYYGNSSGLYPNEVFIGNPGITTVVVDNLAPGSYYFVATAINGLNIESGYSNEIRRTVN